MPEWCDYVIGAAGASGVLTIVIIARMMTGYAPAHGSWHGQVSMTLLLLGILVMGMCTPTLSNLRNPRLTWEALVSLAASAVITSTSVVLAVRSLNAGRERPAFAAFTLLLTPVGVLVAPWSFALLIRG